MNARRLAVELYGRRAGTIERAGGSLTFTYDPEYLDLPRPTPLSLSMPLARTPYTRKWVENYLRGLLPDRDDVRARWAQHFGIKPGDIFGLVAAIGSDAPGGALYLPDDETTPPPAEHGGLSAVDDRAIGARLAALREDDGAWLGDDEYWSLAGAQGKFTLHLSDHGNWAIPHGTHPSTHIVKPGISRLPAQALTEHVSMRAAAQLGLDVAHSEYREFGGEPAIVVQRFDRLRRADGRLSRVHQEDLCQALGIGPAKKYEADGGPGAQRIADLLRTTTDDDSGERFARAVVVNHLLGAPDAHAKNYALLLVGPAVRLAPLYDIASGLASSHRGTLRYPKGAMSIGGERAFGEVEGRHWDAFARRVGIAEERVRAWVAGYAEALPDALRDAIASVPSTAQDHRLLTATLLPRVALLAQIVRNGLNQTRRSGGRVVRPVAHDVGAVGD